MSTDWNSEIGDIAAGEIQNKLYWMFKDSWCVLIAGTIPSALSLMATMRQSIDRKNLTKATKIEDEIANAVLKHRDKLVDRYVRMRHNVSLGYFRIHKADFDEEEWAETSAVVKNILLECQLIVCTFIKRQPFIFLVDEDASVRREENFVAIGTGSTAANAFLYLRNQNEDRSLDYTTYCVFEAAKFARKVKAPGVGKNHAFSVLYPGKRQKRLRGRGIRRLQEYFETYGPREISEVHLSEKHWEKY